jgi:transposase
MAATEKRAVRERASPAVWRERVERWKSSGLTAKEFAATENLSPRSLSWWLWRLQRRGETAKSGPKK